jgi:hypothetical protein
VSNDPPSSKIPPTLLAGTVVETPGERAMREATWPLSLGLFALGLSTALPWERHRSLIASAMREGGAALGLTAVVVGLPLFLGARGGVAALGRTPPGKWAFWPAAVLLFVMGWGVVLLSGMMTAVSFDHPDRTPKVVFLILGLAVLLAVLLVRAARRAAFARWAHLQAGAAVLVGELAAVLRASGDEDLETLTGPRLLILLAVALFPVSLWVLWRGRKREGLADVLAAKPGGGRGLI